jgi:hypothetical protein
MKGFLSCITTNAKDGGVDVPALTEIMYNDLIFDIWTSGGDAKVTYCTGSLKRQISSFTNGVTKTIEAKAKWHHSRVDVYEGDFGTQKILPHRYMPTNTIAALDLNLWALAWLRKTKHTPLAKTGDFSWGEIVGEAALEAREEAGSGKYIRVKYEPEES